MAYSFRSLDLSGITNKYIRFVVSVNIGNSNTGLPGSCPARNTSNAGNVIELQVTLIKIKFVIGHITGKIDILQVIAVDIGGGHAGAIIEIFVNQDVGI